MKVLVHTKRGKSAKSLPSTPEACFRPVDASIVNVTTWSEAESVSREVAKAAIQSARNAGMVISDALIRDAFTVHKRPISTGIFASLDPSTGEATILGRVSRVSGKSGVYYVEQYTGADADEDSTASTWKRLIRSSDTGQALEYLFSPGASIYRSIADVRKLEEAKMDEAMAVLAANAANAANADATVSVE